MKSNMPEEPRKNWWPHLLTVAHYGFPIFIFVCAWFAFREGDVSHRPSSLEIYLACSAVVILVVYTAELAWASRSMKRRLEKQAEGLYSHKAQIEKLEKRLAKLENPPNTSTEARTDPRHSIFSEHLSEQTVPVAHISASYPSAPHLELPSVPPISATPLNLSEDEVILTIRREYTAACRSQNRDARQLITRMQTLTEQIAPSFRVIRVSRDGAIEESSIYRVDASSITAPKDSIAVLLGGGRALLFPAPLAGEDSFMDAKAFESEIPVHLRKRSQLADCVPARLTATARDVYELLTNGKGILHFNND